MGSKPRIKGVCPDQACILWDKKREKEPDKSDIQICKDIGSELEIKWRTVASWLFRDKRATAIAVKKEVNIPKLPEGKFHVIYADPPWKYEFSETKYRALEGEERPYPTLPYDKIKSIPVQEIAGDSSVLFLWVTSPKLQEGLNLVVDWGFSYKTCAVWVKDKIGMGYYFRQQHELLFVATKGKWPAPDPSTRVSSIIKAPRTEHSKKPDILYEIIEKMYPTAKRIELFARNKRLNWESWGNEIAQDS